MRLTIAGKLVAGAIILGIVYLIFQGQQYKSQVNDLAALDDCGLANNYFVWRVSFENDLPPGHNKITGSMLDKFVSKSRSYRDAIRQRPTSPATSSLEKLSRVVEIDAQRDEEAAADLKPAFEDFVRLCPVLAEDFYQNHLANGN